MSETWYSKDKFTLYRQLFVLTRKGIGTELEEVVHTLLTLCRSGWPRGFGSLNLSPHS